MVEVADLAFGALHLCGRGQLLQLGKDEIHLCQCRLGKQPMVIGRPHLKGHIVHGQFALLGGLRCSGIGPALVGSRCPRFAKVLMHIGVVVGLLVVDLAILHPHRQVGKRIAHLAFLLPMLLLQSCGNDLHPVGSCTPHQLIQSKRFLCLSWDAKAKEQEQ